MLKWHRRENTFLVADFDRTITTGEPWCASSFWVFPRAPLPENISKIIKEEARRLFEHYYPLEIDNTIPEDEKIHIMKEWNEKVMELLGDYLNSQMFEKVLRFAESEVKIRDGIKRFFQWLREMWVPIIIFSAGVSNVIERVLQVNEIPYNWIHSNTLWFRDWVLSLINEWVYIWNKGWNSLPKEKQDLVVWRSHKIILWDSLDDLNMWDSARISTSVWFLISEKAENWHATSYRENYDHVVESDFCDKGILEEVLRTLQKA